MPAHTSYRVEAPTRISGPEHSISVFDHVPCLCPTGHAMLKSETVRKIGFTGSTAVGKSLMAQAAQVGGWWCMLWGMQMVQVE